MEYIKEQVATIRLKKKKAVPYAMIVNEHEAFMDRYPTLFRSIFGMPDDQLDALLIKFEQAKEQGTVEAEGKALTQQMVKEELLPKVGHLLNDKERQKLQDYVDN